jgi:hypothetical protein
MVRKVIIITAALTSLIAIGVDLLWQNLVRSSNVGILGHFGLVSSSRLVGNLGTNDPDTIRQSLGALDDNRDPAGIAAAIPLLKSDDDYVWLNAALYLGSFGKTESIPYLIKGLRHTAYRSAPDMVNDLRSMTGQSFGQNYRAGHDWWTSQHHGNDIDFDTHLGPMPRGFPPASQPK